VLKFWVNLSVGEGARSTQLHTRRPRQSLRYSCKIDCGEYRVPALDATPEFLLRILIRPGRWPAGEFCQEINDGQDCKDSRS
jgi:hypothetical protein